MHYFIKKATNPLLFISFCFEYKKYLENPNNFMTNLPIQLDATCNGIQHLSLLSKNMNLAKYVNILSNIDSEKPNDLYDITIKYINNKIYDEVNKSPEYINLKELNLNRSVIKRSIMTISYNVTINGIVNHLEE